MDSPQTGVLDLKADPEHLETDSLAQKRKLIAAARFASGNNKRVRRSLVNSILFSDVLNYVDYEKAIAGFSRHLKPGGRVIAYNQPGLGEKVLLSDNGVRDNHELVRFLEDSGFSMGHLSHAASKAHDADHAEPVDAHARIRLVAVKPGSKSV